MPLKIRNVLTFEESLQRESQLIHAWFSPNLLPNAEYINAPEILLFLLHTQNHTCVFIIVYVQGGIYLSSPPQSTGMVGEKREENALTRTHIYLLMFPSFKALCCLPEFPPSVKFLFSSNLWVLQVENSTICTLPTRFEYGSGASCEQKQFSASTVRRQRLLFVSPFYSVKKP